MDDEVRIKEALVSAYIRAKAAECRAEAWLTLRGFKKDKHGTYVNAMGEPVGALCVLTTYMLELQEH
jgi:hypothetical protein